MSNGNGSVPARLLAKIDRSGVRVGLSALHFESGHRIGYLTLPADLGTVAWRFCIKDAEQPKKAAQAIADLGRLLYDYFILSESLQ
jgi:hypothetical protein